MTLMYSLVAEIDRLHGELQSKVEENTHLKKQLQSKEKDSIGHNSGRNDGLYYAPVVDVWSAIQFRNMCEDPFLIRELHRVVLPEKELESTDNSPRNTSGRNQ